MIILLTNTNYLSWKSHMDDVLRSKGMYYITLGKKRFKNPLMMTSIQMDNRNDEACGLLGMSISPDLRFHLQGIDGPYKAWEKIESVFGKHNNI
jgi:hypothetical protein